MARAALLLLLSLVPAAALAGKPHMATVCIEDPGGEALGLAWLRLLQEGDVHQVNTETGCWSSTAIYNRWGGTTPLGNGVVVDLVISAPGHAPEAFAWDTGQRLVVVLEPVDPGMAWPELGIDPDAVLARPLDKDDPERMAVEAADLLRREQVPEAIVQAERCLAMSVEGAPRQVALAVRAQGLAALWREAAEAAAVAPDEALSRARWEASQRVVEACRAWLEADPPDHPTAMGLCVSAAPTPEVCLP